jgi:hypothetical protein
MKVLVLVLNEQEREDLVSMIQYADYYVGDSPSEVPQPRWYASTDSTLIRRLQEACEVAV